jgi:hypothetical protein
MEAIPLETKEFLAEVAVSEDMLRGCLTRLLSGKINEPVGEAEAHLTALLTELLKARSKQKSVESICSELKLPSLLATSWSEIITQSESASSPFSSSIEFARIRDISWKSFFFVKSRYFAKVGKPSIEVNILLESGKRVIMTCT